MTEKFRSKVAENTTFKEPLDPEVINNQYLKRFYFVVNNQKQSKFM